MSHNVLSINDLSLGYYLSKKKKKIIQHNISLSALEGELIMLIGANGTGKSTLLRTLLRFQPALEGEIFLFNKPLLSYSQHQLAKQISYVSTEIVQQTYMTVFELVAYGRTPYLNRMGTLSEADKNMVYKALDWVGMLHFAKRFINEISDGERQRVMIARALAQDTPIIFLDEPTAFLDLAHRYEIVRLLKYLSENQHKTIVLSTHDLHIALRQADKIWLMLANKVLQGTPEDLALANEFENLFNSTENQQIPLIRFDSFTGDFVSHTPQKGSFNIVSKMEAEEYYLWTKRALNRMGYSVDADDPKRIFIDIFEKNIVWQFNSLTFTSIDALLLFIGKNYPSN